MTKYRHSLTALADHKLKFNTHQAKPLLAFLREDKQNLNCIKKRELIFKSHAQVFKYDSPVLVMHSIRGGRDLLLNTDAVFDRDCLEIQIFQDTLISIQKTLTQSLTAKHILTFAAVTTEINSKALISAKCTLDVMYIEMSNNVIVRFSNTKHHTMKKNKKVFLSSCGILMTSFSIVLFQCQRVVKYTEPNQPAGGVVAVCSVTGKCSSAAGVQAGVLLLPSSMRPCSKSHSQSAAGHGRSNTLIVHCQIPQNPAEVLEDKIC